VATTIRPGKYKVPKVISKPPEQKSKSQNGKEAILEILARAADDSKFLARLADNPEEALSEYYVLSWEERAALASGDIKKIEGWGCGAVCNRRNGNHLPIQPLNRSQISLLMEKMRGAI